MSTSRGDAAWPSRLRAAAWVPDNDPHRPWDDAAELAADWIWDRADEEHAAAIAVTNTLQIELPASLEAIAQRGGRATPQAKGRPQPGPVVVYVPDERTLRTAMDLARGFSLVAIEGSLFSLSQWAAGVGAVNLLDGSISTTDLPPQILKDLDSAVLFGGNNGWSGPHEKEHARRHLANHVRNGVLTPEQAASYVMAHGVSDRGAKRLRELLERNRARRS
jgi:hypothetical protein